MSHQVVKHFTWTERHKNLSARIFLHQWHTNIIIHDMTKWATFISCCHCFCLLSNVFWSTVPEECHRIMPAKCHIIRQAKPLFVDRQLLTTKPLQPVQVKLKVFRSTIKLLQQKNKTKGMFTCGHTLAHIHRIYTHLHMYVCVCVCLFVHVHVCTCLLDPNPRCPAMIPIGERWQYVQYCCYFCLT